MFEPRYWFEPGGVKDSVIFTLFYLQNCQKHGPPIFSARKMLGTEKLHASSIPQLRRLSQTFIALKCRSQETKPHGENTAQLAFSVPLLSKREPHDGSGSLEEIILFDPSKTKNKEVVWLWKPLEIVPSWSILLPRQESRPLGPPILFFVIHHPREPFLLFPPFLCVLFKKGLACSYISDYHGFLLLLRSAAQAL